MILLPIKNNFDVFEIEMQKQLIEILKNTFEYTIDYDEKIYPSVFKEFSVPEINRRSDIVVALGNKLINVECKLSNYASVLAQAKDHLSWADYSYVCLHYKAFVPNYIMHDFIKNGIGVIYWTEKEFIEVLCGYSNTYKNGKKVKNIRDSVNKRIQILKSKETGSNEKQLNII